MEFFIFQMHLHQIMMGINDLFSISLFSVAQLSPIAELTIYNGQNSIIVGESWDGTFNNTDAEDGVYNYTYKILLPDTAHLFTDGQVSLVRNINNNTIFNNFPSGVDNCTFGDMIHPRDGFVYNIPNANSATATFLANVSDSCVIITDFLNAFISGNDTLCDNENMDAEVKIYFSGATPPVTFVYAINGVSQPSITTTINPYVIYTQQAGVYTLTYFSDANNSGSITGSAMVHRFRKPCQLLILSLIV